MTSPGHANSADFKNPTFRRLYDSLLAGYLSALESIKVLKPVSYIFSACPKTAVVISRILGYINRFTGINQEIEA